MPSRSPGRPEAEPNRTSNPTHAVNQAPTTVSTAADVQAQLPTVVVDETSLDDSPQATVRDLSSRVRATTDLAELDAISAEVNELMRGIEDQIMPIVDGVRTLDQTAVQEFGETLTDIVSIARDAATTPEDEARLANATSALGLIANGQNWSAHIGDARQRHIQEQAYETLFSCFSEDLTPSVDGTAPGPAQPNSSPPEPGDPAAGDGAGIGTPPMAPPGPDDPWGEQRIQALLHGEPLDRAAIDYLKTVPGTIVNALGTRTSLPLDLNSTTGSSWSTLSTPANVETLPTEVLIRERLYAVAEALIPDSADPPPVVSFKRSQWRADAIAQAVEQAAERGEAFDAELVEPPPWLVGNNPASAADGERVAEQLFAAARTLETTVDPQAILNAERRLERTSVLNIRLAGDDEANLPTRTVTFIPGIVHHSGAQLHGGTEFKAGLHGKLLAQTRQQIEEYLAENAQLPATQQTSRRAAQDQQLRTLLEATEHAQRTLIPSNASHPAGGAAPHNALTEGIAQVVAGIPNTAGEGHQRLLEFTNQLTDELQHQQSHNPRAWAITAKLALEPAKEALLALAPSMRSDPAAMLAATNLAATFVRAPGDTAPPPDFTGEYRLSTAELRELESIYETARDAFSSYSPTNWADIIEDSGMAPPTTDLLGDEVAPADRSYFERFPIAAVPAVIADSGLARNNWQKFDGPWRLYDAEPGPEDLAEPLRYRAHAQILSRLFIPGKDTDASVVHRREAWCRAAWNATVRQLDAAYPDREFDRATPAPWLPEPSSGTSFTPEAAAVGRVQTQALHIQANQPSLASEIQAWERIQRAASVAVPIQSMQGRMSVATLCLGTVAPDGVTFVGDDDYQRAQLEGGIYAALEQVQDWHHELAVLGPEERTYAASIRASQLATWQTVLLNARRQLSHGERELNDVRDFLMRGAASALDPLRQVTTDPANRTQRLVDAAESLTRWLEEQQRWNQVSVPVTAAHTIAVVHNLNSYLVDTNEPPWRFISELCAAGALTANCYEPNQRLADVLPTGFQDPMLVGLHTTLFAAHYETDTQAQGFFDQSPPDPARYRLPVGDEIAMAAVFLTGSSLEPDEEFVEPSIDRSRGPVLVPVLQEPSEMFPEVETAFIKPELFVEQGSRTAIGRLDQALRSLEEYQNKALGPRPRSRINRKHILETCLRAAQKDPESIYAIATETFDQLMADTLAVTELDIDAERGRRIRTALEAALGKRGLTFGGAFVEEEDRDSAPFDTDDWLQRFPRTVNALTDSVQIAAELDRGYLEKPWLDLERRLARAENTRDENVRAKRLADRDDACEAFGREAVQTMELPAQQIMPGDERKQEVLAKTSVHTFGVGDDEIPIPTIDPDSQFGRTPGTLRHYYIGTLLERDRSYQVAIYRGSAEDTYAVRRQRVNRCLDRLRAEVPVQAAGIDAYTLIHAVLADELNGGEGPQPARHSPSGGTDHGPIDQSPPSTSTRRPDAEPPQQRPSSPPGTRRPSNRDPRSRHRRNTARRANSEPMAALRSATEEPRPPERQASPRAPQLAADARHQPQSGSVHRTRA